MKTKAAITILFAGLVGAMLFAPQSPAQTSILGTLIGMTQLPRCPQSGQFVYFTSAASTGPRLAGCAAIGSGLTLNTGTNPPTITAATSSPVYASGLIPGIQDGTNGVFTLPGIPQPGSLMIFRNGIAQSASVDYGLSGRTVTFSAASIPQLGDTLSYFYAQ